VLPVAVHSASSYMKTVQIQVLDAVPEARVASASKRKKGRDRELELINPTF
jgi:hypothetical protein